MSSALPSWADAELILDAADIAAPALRDTARRFLEAEAQHLGVPPDPGSVMAHRAEGVAELHITAAADEMLKHLMDAEERRLHDAGTDRRAGDHD